MPQTVTQDMFGFHTKSYMNPKSGGQFVTIKYEKIKTFIIWIV